MRITITATGEYPHPEAFNKRPLPESTTPAEALAAAIEAHMKAYGFKDVLVTMQAPPVEEQAAEVLDLGVRAYNCLKLQMPEPQTIGHLQKMKARELLAFKHCGPRTVGEIIVAMERIGKPFQDQHISKPIQFQAECWREYWAR
jgi:DNA-directed RNA polymerase alpha subunit